MFLIWKYLEDRALLCRVKDNYWLILANGQPPERWAGAHVFLDTGCASHLLCLCYWSSRSCGLWTGLLWEGGNTIVLVSNLERPLGLQSASFLTCVCQVGSRVCVLLWGSGRGGSGGPPSWGREKASDWHVWFRSITSQLRIHFSKILPFALRSALPPFTALGTVGAAGRKSPFFMPFTLRVPPHWDLSGGSGPHPKSHLYLAACLAIPAQGPDSCLKYWLAWQQLPLTLCSQRHRNR